jgi:DNA-binding PucR family transcriptional regulator
VADEVAAIAERLDALDVSPAVQREAQALRDLVARVRAAGHRVDVRVTWEQDDAIIFTREAAARGVDTVVAVGGDGTVLTALRAAAPTDTPVLGVACGSLGVLTAVGADDLAEALERRHFEALDREGQSGRDVEETVRALLEHDQNADDVSRAMHVHRNTVRYRLGRFRELTGLDLRRTDDLVTAWWLLARRAARRAR